MHARKLSLGLLYTVERRFQRNQNQTKFYLQSTDAYLEKGLLKTLSGKKWYLPHHQVLNKKKTGKLEVFAMLPQSKVKLAIGKLLAGPELIHVLIGAIFKFQEGTIYLTAEIKSIFPQSPVSEKNKSCLRFLWGPRTNKLFKYTKNNVIGVAKSSSLKRGFKSLKRTWRCKCFFVFERRVAVIRSLASILKACNPRRE